MCTGYIDTNSVTFSIWFNSDIRRIMKFLVIYYAVVLLGLWQKCCSYPIDNEEHSMRMYSL